MTDHAPYVLINTFTAEVGDVDALVALQLAETAEMDAQATSCGWLGNEVYRSVDGASLIVVTRFQSEEAKEKWAATERFRQHLEALMPLVKNVSSVPVTFVAAHGGSPMRAHMSRNR